MRVASAAMMYCNARYEDESMEDDRLEHLEQALSCLPKDLHDRVIEADWADCAMRAKDATLSPAEREVAFERIAMAMSEYFGKLAPKFSGRNKLHWATEEDVKQECLLGLHKAIQDYSARRGSFMSFAKLWVRRHLITVSKL